MFNKPNPPFFGVPVESTDYDADYHEAYVNAVKDRNRLEKERDALIAANDELRTKLNNLSVTANWSGYDA